MNYLKSAFFIVVLCFSAQASAKEMKVVGNKDLAFKLKKGRQQVRLKGSIAFNMVASERELKRGKLGVRDFNILLHKVPQILLTGKQPRKQKHSGVGFSVKLGKQLQQLQYHPRTGAVKGRLEGSVHFAQLNELRPVKINPKLDNQYYPTLPAVVDVQWTSAPLVFANGCGPGPVVIRMRIGVRIIGDPEMGIGQTVIWTDEEIVAGSFGCLENTRVQREICLQPVKIKSSNTDINPTGAGMWFGMPGANAEWEKANVKFKIRSFKTIVDSDLKVFSSAESNDMLGKVDDSDCIEIYFAESFSPSALFGGGATFGSGTSGAKIITSDENAANGIDLTHLAHELGHVMGLTHPGDGNPSAARPNVTDGSSGTLMCGSGFNNDNPQVNSQENEDNLSNPLFKFKLRNGTDSPDCEDSADCGACP